MTKSMEYNTEEEANKEEKKRKGRRGEESEEKKKKIRVEVVKKKRIKNIRNKKTKQSQHNSSKNRNVPFLFHVKVSLSFWPSISMSRRMGTSSSFWQEFSWICAGSRSS